MKITNLFYKSLMIMTLGVIFMMAFNSSIAFIVGSAIGFIVPELLKFAPSFDTGFFNAVVWMDADGKFKSLKSEELKKLPDEDQWKYRDAESNHYKQTLENLENQIKKSKDEEGSEKLTELQKEFSKLKNDTLRQLFETVKTQGEVLYNINGTQSSIKDIEDTASLVIKEIKNNLDAYKSGKLNIELQQKEVTSGASVVDNTFSYRESGIGKEPVRRVFISNLFTQGRVGANSGGKITYLDQNVLVRNANNVAECTLIPTSDISWRERSQDVEKIGDSIPICTESLEDFDFIQSEVENFLFENVLLRIDEQVMFGTGVKPELRGIDTFAQTWSVGVGSPIEQLAASVQAPTIANVAFTGISQIKNSGQNNTYMPNAIFMNPVDYQLMLLDKDTDNNSLNDRLVRIADDGTVRISGVRVYETPLVIQDTMYVADMPRATFYNHRGLTLTSATEHDQDFMFDRIRLKLTTRKSLVVKQQNINAFLKVDSIAAAIVALTKV